MNIKRYPRRYSSDNREAYTPHEGYVEEFDEVDLGVGADAYVIVRKKAEHDLNFNIQEDNGQFTITDLDASKDLLAQINEGDSLKGCLVEFQNCSLATSIDILQHVSSFVTQLHIKKVPAPSFSTDHISVDLDPQISPEMHGPSSGKIQTDVGTGVASSALNCDGESDIKLDNNIQIKAGSPEFDPPRASQDLSTNIHVDPDANMKPIRQFDSKRQSSIDATADPSRMSFVSSAELENRGKLYGSTKPQNDLDEDSVDFEAEAPAIEDAEADVAIGSVEIGKPEAKFEMESNTPEMKRRAFLCCGGGKGKPRKPPRPTMHTDPNINVQKHMDSNIDVEELPEVSLENNGFQNTGKLSFHDDLETSVDHLDDLIVTEQINAGVDIQMDDRIGTKDQPKSSKERKGGFGFGRGLGGEADVDVDAVVDHKVNSSDRSRSRSPKEKKGGFRFGLGLGGDADVDVDADVDKKVKSRDRSRSKSPKEKKGGFGFGLGLGGDADVDLDADVDKKVKSRDRSRSKSPNEKKSGFGFGLGFGGDADVDVDADVDKKVKSRDRSRSKSPKEKKSGFGFGLGFRGDADVDVDADVDKKVKSRDRSRSKSPKEKKGGFGFGLGFGGDCDAEVELKPSVELKTVETPTPVGEPVKVDLALEDDIALNKQEYLETIPVKEPKPEYKIIIDPITGAKKKLRRKPKDGKANAKAEGAKDYEIKVDPKTGKKYKVRKRDQSGDKERKSKPIAEVISNDVNMNAPIATVNNDFHVAAPVLVQNDRLEGKIDLPDGELKSKDHDGSINNANGGVNIGVSLDTEENNFTSQKELSLIDKSLEELRSARNFLLGSGQSKSGTPSPKARKPKPMSGSSSEDSGD